MPPNMLGFLGCFIVCMAFQKSSVDNAYQVYDFLLYPVLFLSRTILPRFPVSTYPAGRYIYDVALSVTKIPCIYFLSYIQHPVGRIANIYHPITLALIAFIDLNSWGTVVC